jgi:hypothetical protein
MWLSMVLLLPSTAAAALAHSAVADAADAPAAAAAAAAVASDVYTTLSKRFNDFQDKNKAAQYQRGAGAHSSTHQALLQLQSVFVMVNSSGATVAV